MRKKISDYFQTYDADKVFSYFTDRVVIIYDK